MAARPTRREFLATLTAGMGAGGLRVALPQMPGQTAQQIVDRLREKAGVPWREGTADGFKAGSPATSVRGVAAAVMATIPVLRQAADAGHNLVVVQEPTFYTAADDGAGRAGDPVLAAKRALIDERQLVVWRFSDHWNARQPSEPVAALANALGWSTNARPGADGLYTVPDMRLDALIEHLRARLHAGGGLRWLGPPDLRIRTVLLSPGTTDLASTVARMPQADVIVAGEPREWEAVPYVLDMRPRKALVSLGRIVSLEPSAAACAAWMRSVLPDLRVTAIPSADPYWSPVA